MANQKKTTTGENVVDLQVAVGVLQSQMQEIKQGQERIETKIDSISFVSKADFKEQMDSMTRTYATMAALQGLREEMAPLKKAYYGFLASVGTFLLAIIIFLFQRALGGG